MVTRATIDHSQLMLVTKAIADPNAKSWYLLVLLSLWSVNQINKWNFSKIKINVISSMKMKTENEIIEFIMLNFSERKMKI